MKKTPRLVPFAAALSTALLLLLFTASIFAEQSDAIVPVTLPEDFSDPENLHLISCGEDRLAVSGTQGQKSFATLLDGSGAALDTVSVDFECTYTFSRKDRFYFVCPMKMGKNPVVSGIRIISYFLSGDSFEYGDAVILPNVFATGINEFYADDDGNFYSTNNLSPDSLLVFDETGELLLQVQTKRGAFSSICISPGGTLYAMYTGDSRIGVLPLPMRGEGDLPLLDSSLPVPVFRFLDETTVLDGAGTLFSVSADTGVFSTLSETGGQCECACILPDGGAVVKTAEDAALEFRDGNAAAQYRFGGTLLDLAGSGKTAAALVRTEDGLTFAPLSQVPKEDIESSDPGSGEPGPASEPSSPESGSGIESEKYRIDRAFQRIYIPEKTTYAVVKDSILIPDGVLRAEKPNGTALTGGYVMTGACLNAVVDGETTDSLTVIVPGDLTGTGSISSTDSRLLYRFLNGSADLEGNAFAAADFDGDDRLTTADLLALKKKIQESP
ncbi:MAG TPA: hypothetical protein DD433_09680 [Ruminococcaceae bacterium]|jgi:hypothetical protein|nr:hypothetical protein [Oscillospiraceae bacterium]